MQTGVPPMTAMRVRTERNAWLGVGLGSEAEARVLPTKFRFAPQSRHIAGQSGVAATCRCNLISSARVLMPKTVGAMGSHLRFLRCLGTIAAPAASLEFTLRASIGCDLPMVRWSRLTGRRLLLCYLTTVSHARAPIGRPLGPRSPGTSAMCS